MDEYIIKYKCKYDKMKILYKMSEILEYGSHDKEYDFPIKGHNLNDDDVIIFINMELFTEGENLRIKQIISKEEECYKISRFYEGQDAKDEGNTSWIFICPLSKYKKGLGKCTSYKVTLERFDDE